MAIPGRITVSAYMTGRVDESHLTGEADTVGKRPDGAPLLFSGSKVLEGGGRALVTAVGANSQQGLISGMVASAGEQGDSLRWGTIGGVSSESPQSAGSRPAA